MICQLCGKVHTPLWPEDVERIRTRVFETMGRSIVLAAGPELTHDIVRVIDQLIMRETQK